jgi:hypothetical protein
MTAMEVMVGRVYDASAEQSVSTARQFELFLLPVRLNLPKHEYGRVPR